MKIGSRVQMIAEPDMAGEILDAWFPDRYPHDPAWMVHWFGSGDDREIAHGVWHSSELLELGPYEDEEP